MLFQNKQCFLRVKSRRANVPTWIPSLFIFKLLFWYRYKRAHTFGGFFSGSNYHDLHTFLFSTCLQVDCGVHEAMLWTIAIAVIVEVLRRTENNFNVDDIKLQQSIKINNTKMKRAYCRQEIGKKVKGQKNLVFCDGGRNYDSYSCETWLRIESWIDLL